jgi:hypothetical protein
MAETTPTPVLDRPDDAARYQPLSLLAVAAIVTTSLYTITVLVLTVMGLYSRKPVLEPVLILLAVVGVCVALAARWHVANSEGTRAGMGLAKAALWMVTVCGLCYVAYFVGNLLAIRDQASKFVVRNWFEPMKEGNQDEAFRSTIDPAQRKNRSAKDIATLYPEPVETFRHMELAQVIDRARGETQIEPQGVRNWSKETSGYMVVLNFLIRTREGEFDTVVAAMGNEPKDSTGREWFIQKAQPLITQRRLTTYGRMINELQFDAQRFLTEWLMTKVAQNRENDIYLDTLPLSVEERQRQHRDYVLRGWLGAGLITGAQPSNGMAQAITLGELCGDRYINQVWHLPRSAGYAKSLIVFENSRPNQISDTDEQLRGRLLRESSIAFPRHMMDAEVPPQLQMSDNEIRVGLWCLFRISIPNQQYKALVFASATNPALVQKIRELRSQPWPAPIVVDNSPSVLTAYPPEWRISEIRVDPNPYVDPRMQQFMGSPQKQGGP